MRRKIQDARHALCIYIIKCISQRGLSWSTCSLRGASRNKTAGNGRDRPRWFSTYRSPRARPDCTYMYRNAQIGFTSRGLIDVYAAVAPMVERNPIRRAIRESKRSSDASFVESLRFPPPLPAPLASTTRSFLSSVPFFLSFPTDRGIIPTRLLSGLSRGPGPRNPRGTILISLSSR